MSARDAEAMRARLASVGIILDPPPAPRPVAPAATTAPVDRELVRSILVELGAPESAIDWLTASCPSIDLARGYRPPEAT